MTRDRDRCRRPIFALTTLLVAVAIPAAAWAQDVSRLDRPTPIAAYGGWLAWSGRGGDGGFRLMLRQPDGSVREAPIAARSVPFDVDLGPGESGQVVAVYSRCAREVGSPGSFLPADFDEGAGCDLYRLDLAGDGRERGLPGASTDDADETWPSIWRDRIAFVRSYDRKPIHPYLYVRPLAGGSSVRQPGGQRRVCSRDRGRASCTDDRVSRPYALELYGRRLAFGWTYAGYAEGLDTEIRMDTLGDGHARIAAQGGGGMTGRALGWPAFEAGRVYMTRACYGDTSGCVARDELLRYRITTRSTDGAEGPKPILSHDRSGDVTWLLVDEMPGTDCQGDPARPGGTCLLRGLRPPFGG